MSPQGVQRQDSRRTWRPPRFRPGGAPCRRQPALFFPRDGERDGAARVAAAKAICGTCATATACLREALANEERHGIWGGTTEDERASMARSIAARRARERRRQEAS